MDFFKKLIKNKKFKYGALAACFTVAVIAVIVIANVIISSLAEKYFWYYDMTSDTIYTPSKNSTALIDTQKDRDNEVTIYFLTDKERLNSSAAASFNTSYAIWGMKNIYSLASALDEKYDFISIEHIDITSEPEKIKEIYGEKYSDYYKTTTFSAINVIVKNETFMRGADGEFIIDTITGERTPECFVRTLTRNDFYTADGFGYLNGFCGDFKLTSAVVGVCTPASNVYFLKGHGEDIGASASDFGSAGSLSTLFKDAGFNVAKVDLASESISPSGACNIMVIFAPKTDITALSEGELAVKKSESEKIREFLNNPSNHLMVFMGENKNTLDNLEAILLENGIGVESAKLRDSGSAGISVDGYTLVGAATENNIISRVENKDAKAVFSYARALYVKEGGAAYSIVDAAKSSVPDGTLKYPESDNLSLLAASTTESGSRILVCGSTYFSSGANLYGSVYSNRDILLSAFKEMGKEELPLNIATKILDGERLDITKSQALGWTILVSCVIPIITAAIGVVIYIRRRHS